MADLAQAASLISQLDALRERLTAGADQDTVNKAQQLSKQLTLSLSHPVDVAVDLAFSPFIEAAARIAIDLNLFKLIAGHGPLSLAGVRFRTITFLNTFAGVWRGTELASRILKQPKYFRSTKQSLQNNYII
jgi:hypothetical protein